MKLTSLVNRRRKLVASLGAAALIASALTLPAAAASGEPDTRSTHAKPTVVLVHGAFADASGWNGVIKGLQEDGYPVIAPANPLRGLAGDAAYIKSVLTTIEGPIILVAHSYGGSVITVAADGVSQMKALVYISGFIPDVGDSITSIDAMFPGSILGQNVLPKPFSLVDGTTGVDIYIQPAKFRETFAADLPKSVTALMAVTQRPISAAALNEPATVAAWKTIPSWSLIAKDDKANPATAQRFMSERAGATIVEVKSSHAALISHADDVLRLVEKAAAATTN